MITCIIKNIKTLDQNTYNNFIDQLPIHQLTCSSCHHSGCLTKHAYYNRAIKTPMGKVILRILRVKCSHCNTTHAILLISMVPYSQVLYKDHIRIITQYIQGNDFEDIMMDTIDIDESSIQYIIKQYLRHWKERVLSYSITLNEMMYRDCFKYFNRAFMQIKCTPNKLYSCTHIT